MKEQIIKIAKRYGVDFPLRMTDEIMAVIEDSMPTDKEIEDAFTSEHYHWEKGRYYKVRKDRILGAKWFRSRMKGE